MPTHTATSEPESPFSTTGTSPPETLAEALTSLLDPPPYSDDVVAALIAVADWLDTTDPRTTDAVRAINSVLFVSAHTAADTAEDAEPTWTDGDGTGWYGDGAEASP